MSLAGPIQQNVGVTANIGGTSQAQETVVPPQQGAFRGQRVTTGGAGSSKITQAVRRSADPPGRQADIATLSRRSLRQGQAAQLQSTPRIVDHFDKLPNMPQMEALQSLVETLQTFQDELVQLVGHRVHAATQGHHDSATDAVDPSDASLAERARSGLLQKDTAAGAGQQGGSGGFGGDRPSVADIQALLQKMDGDVTHQFAALDIVRDFFRTEGAAPEFQELLADAARAFETPELMREVRAGQAAARVAHEAAQTLETDPAAVRNAYRSMLREEKNFGQLFEALTRFDVTKSFSSLVEVFRTAAGRDLEAGAFSSVEPLFLHSLLTELGKLKQMESVVQMSDDLVSKMKRLIPAGEQAVLDPVRVAGDVLNFAAKTTVGISDARALLDPVEATGPASQVAWMNGVRGLHAQIPDDAIASPQARLQQVTTLASVQNNLVAAEEAAYAAARGRPTPQAG